MGAGGVPICRPSMVQHSNPFHLQPRTYGCNNSIPLPLLCGIIRNPLTIDSPLFQGRGLSWDRSASSPGRSLMEVVCQGRLYRLRLERLLAL